MKSYRTPLILGLVLLALGGVAFWDEKKTKEEETLNSNKNKLFSVNKDDVTDLVYATPNKTPPENITLKKRDGTWVITSPVDAKADQTAVSNLLENVSTFQYEKDITADTSRYGEFGLEKPATVLSFNTKKEKHTVQIGDKSNIGYSVYFRVDEDPKVYLGSQVLATATEKTLHDFRDKALAQIDLDKVIRVALNNDLAKESVVLDKKDGAWTMAQPLKVEADGDQVASFLEEITMENVQAFHDNPPENLVKASTDVKNQIAEVSWQTDSGPATTLKVWQAESKFYAAFDTQKVIFEVPATLKEKVNKTATDFRNRKVFNFSSKSVQKIMIDGQSFVQSENKWVKEQTESEKAKEPADNISMLLADLEFAKAEGFVEKEQLKSYGPPSHIVELAFDEKTHKDNLKINMWIEPQDKEKVIFSHSDSEYVYLLPKSAIANLSMSKSSTSKIEAPKQPEEETL
jgi:hypothetical protein